MDAASVYGVVLGGERRVKFHGRVEDIVDARCGAAAQFYAFDFPCSTGRGGAGVAESDFHLLSGVGREVDYAGFDE